MISDAATNRFVPGEPSARRPGIAPAATALNGVERDTAVVAEPLKTAPVGAGPAALSGSATGTSVLPRDTSLVAEPDVGAGTEFTARTVLEAGAAHAAGAEKRPVFVDMSGRRGRTLRRLGLVAGGVLILFLSALGIGVATGAGVPLTPWTGQPGHPGSGEHAPSHPGSKNTGRGGAKSTPGSGRAGAPGARASGIPGSAPSGAGNGGSSQSPTSSSPSAAADPAPSTASPSPTATRPGRSHASPPAVGRTKKP